MSVIMQRILHLKHTLIHLFLHYFFIPMKIIKGSPVTKQNNPRPQAIRHGVVKEIQGRYALVKFHGGTKPQKTLISELTAAQP